MDKYIKGLLTNDSSIIREIYSEYYPSIVALVKKNKIGNEDDAWGIFQEALALILVKAREPNFELTSSFFSFFYGICKFLWKNESKKKYRTEVTFEDDSTYINEVNIETVIHESNQMNLYREKFKELGERCQKLLELRFGRISFKEIVKIMGYANENAAKQQGFKCKQQLIKKIKADNRYKELSS